MIKCYALIVAYDGTGFYGWVPQPGLPTIAQVMQDTFYAVFKQKIALVGASRTDAGVHSLGQVVRFHASIDLCVGTIKKVWNARLPESIVIRSLEEFPENTFNPFYAIAYKTYYYHFFLERPLPFLSRYAFYAPRVDNLSRLNEVLQLFVGTHDFTSFSTGIPIGENPVCRIDSINFSYFKRFRMYQISITGDRFLRHMVRRLVGAAFLVAEKKARVSIHEVADIFDQKKINSLLPTAPAKGLLLYKICYK